MNDKKTLRDTADLKSWFWTIFVDTKIEPYSFIAQGGNSVTND